MPRKIAASRTRRSKNTCDSMKGDIVKSNLENSRKSPSTFAGVCTSQDSVLSEISDSKFLRDYESANDFSRNERKGVQDIKNEVFASVKEERILVDSDFSDKLCADNRLVLQYHGHTEQDVLDSPVLSHLNERTIVSEIVNSKISATSDISHVMNQITKDNDIRYQENIVNSHDENVDNKLIASTDEDNKIPFMCSDMSKNRKRKWISKKVTEILSPILSISTDSLKNLISDVHPVPLSDIHLDSSSEVEEVRNEWEHSVKNSPKSVKGLTGVGIPLLEKENIFIPREMHNLKEDTRCAIFRSPSPSRHKESNILYITNLVRPFTVLQLKGLLARTGKIVDDGFWIDRIKSKCFVKYETEDEAIETRHALHGIRWPTSNPKCLNVDFGKMEDMQRAISMKKNTDDINSLSKHGRKIIPVREWDVGKNNNFDGDKKVDNKKARSNNFQKERDFLKIHGNEGNDKKHNYRKESSTSSISPVRKQIIRENDPPLRLLDDLFRKTQTTPCIYWLPLTPEQIAEKGNIRKKRIVEQQERKHQREMDRIQTYERENERFKEKNQEREKEHGLNRSVERRVSRTRDKRWN